MVDLSPDQFAARFAEAFTDTAFRLELRDHYVAPNEVEPLRVFLAGETPDPAWREPWKRFVRAATAAGRHLARVHVVTEPLSDYLRFELICAYPANVEAGEDVRILPRRVAATFDLPERDYWLFDDRRTAVMAYDDAGNWLSVHILDDPDQVAPYRRGRDVAMGHALPLATYLSRHQSELRVRPARG